MHLHVIPRYAGPRTLAGCEFVDPDWPGHYGLDLEYIAPRDVVDAIAASLAPVGGA